MRRRGEPRSRTVPALGSIGVAVLARAQFLLLLGVFALAVVVDALLEARGACAARARATLVRTRKPLLVAYLAMAVTAIVLALRGDLPRLLGSYATTAHGLSLDLETMQLTFEQVAVLALGLAILPFLAGDSLAHRPPPRRPLRTGGAAFAAVGSITLVLVLLQSRRSTSASAPGR